MMLEFPYDKRAIGSRVKERRKSLHLTQDQLAERIDRSKRLVIDVERGVTGFALETLFALCRALEVTPNDLLLSSAKPSETELLWLVEALSACSEHDRHMAIELIRTYLRLL